MSSWASRILSTVNLRFREGLDPKVLETARFDSPEAVEAYVKKLDGYGSLTATERLKVRSVFLAIHYLADASYRAGGTAAVPLANLLNTGKRSFKIPYVQESFRGFCYSREAHLGEWLRANPTKTLRNYVTEHNILDSAAASAKSDAELQSYMYSPEAFIAAARRENSSTYQFLRAFLGESYEPAAAKIVRTQKSRHWAFFDRLYRPGPPELDPGSTLATVAAKGEMPAFIRTSVDESVRHIRSINAGRALGLPDKVFDRITLDKERLASAVEKLFKAYSADGELTGLTAKAVRKLIGKSPRHTGQIMDEIVGGYCLVYQQCYRVALAKGLSGDDAIKAADALMDTLLTVRGFENFYEMLLRQLLHEHGYIFEQLVTIAFIRKGYPVDLLIVQSRIADEMAPDLLVLIRKTVDGTPRVVARITQMKSFKSLGQLIRATKSGEVLKKTKNDIRRLIRSVNTQDNVGVENIGLTYDSVVSLKLDWWRLQKDAYEANVDDVIANISDPAIRKQLTDLATVDPAAVFMSTDPATSKAVRAAFKKLYVDDKVAELNKALAGYEDEWVKLFLKDDRSATKGEMLQFIDKEFDTHLPHYPGDGRDDFYAIKALIESGKPKDVIETSLKALYRKRFGLKATESIKVEIDLVDSMVDDTIPDYVP